jgi:hypothetical protein
MRSNRSRSERAQNVEGHHGGSTESIAKRKGEEAIKTNMRKCPHPGCGQILLDRDYDKHVRGHEKRIPGSAPANLETLWKIRFASIDPATESIRELRKKIKAANALFPETSNQRHWVEAQLQCRNKTQLREKLRSLLENDWGFS